MYGRDSRRNHGGTYNNSRYVNGSNYNRTGQTRNHVIPNGPPYTAYIGNAPDTMVQGDFEHQLFVGLKVKQVRLVRDRQTDRFRGFAYVDFEDADSLRNAIALDGTCVNDRPIRIDVASRPLNAAKSEGFRNKPGFEARNDPRFGGGFRQGERDGNQYRESHMTDGSYHENGYTDDYYKKRTSNEQTDSRKNSDRQSQEQTEQTPSTPQPLSSRKISDDVFIAPDTPLSNEDENQQQIDNQEDTTTMFRQKTRNWADCPIDESVVDTSPPSSINHALTREDADDFQIVRNRTPKSRSTQNISSRLMNNLSMRGRNTGNYSRGVPSSGNGRQFYDQMSSSYSNQSQPYYHNHSQIPPHLGVVYQTNRQPPPSSSSESRQRLNSNQNYRLDPSSQNSKRLTSATSSSSYDISTASSENRPRLQLLPRSQKLSSSTDDSQPIELPTRNPSIFGSGKPRDEHDPQLVELNKHIEEVVEKEQHIQPTSANEPTTDVIKPVRILKARSDSSTTP